MKKKVLLILMILASALSMAACVTPSTEPTKLDAPTNLRCTDTMLTWDAVVGASSYSVQVDNYPPISNGPYTSCSLITLTEAKDYSIKVRAIGDGIDYTDSDLSTPFIYTVTESVAFSDSSLIGLTVKSGTLSPAFDAGVFDYTVTLAYGVELPTSLDNITATPNENFSSIGTTLSGRDFTITVTAQNGTKSIYTISYQNEAPDLDASLSAIAIKSGALSPAFSATVYSYVVNMPYLAELPTDIGDVTGTATSDLANAVTTVSNNVFTITVTAQDKSITKKYTVTYQNLIRVIFVFDNGSEADYKDIESGTKVTRPATDPTFAGMEFDNWYTISGKDLFDFNSNVTANTIIIYANWVTEGLLFEPIANNSRYSVSRGTATASTIVLPSYYNGKPVAAIGSFQNYTALESITISNNITSIADNSFKHCTALSSVTISDSVTSINSSAFEGCTSLADIDIPEKVTNIGGSAFKNCTLLSNLTIPDSVTFISISAFEGCTSLASINIPKNVASIGFSAFLGCTSLTGITVDAENTSFKTINGNLYSMDGTRLIKYASAKTDTVFEIPNSVSIIESYAFSDSKHLVSVTIPDGVTSIGWYVFSSCTALTNITIPDSVTVIDTYAFIGCTALTNITIPDNVVSIGAYAFRSCTALESIVIPNSVTSIGSYAFYDCTSLANIVLSDSITSIGTYTFFNCTALTNIVLPDGLLSIDANAFNNCSALTSITIPASVNTIGDMAFSGCSALKSIVIPDGVTKIGSYTFNYCIALTSIVIPNSVTIIDSYAFYNCTVLASIVIPDSVTSIGTYAFHKCTSLASIVIPASVTSLNSFVFYGCTSLIDVTVKRTSAQGITDIGSDPFSNCRNLENIFVEDEDSLEAYKESWFAYEEFIKLAPQENE